MTILFMAVDMVYDLLKKHNPMLACVIEGHDILYCAEKYQIYVKDAHYQSNGQHIRSNPFYHMAHISHRERAKAKPDIVKHFSKGNSKKHEPNAVSIPHSVYDRDRRRKIEKQPYSSLFR